ncbi:FAD/NAD(P)-binding protein [Natrarchaeobaculum aegyptiacum]|uniref:Thioredoxin reductase n=1 Tax=Natrarchaeobaculum aegyptiacum TaxID=745377 RepID=A0A2Z2HN82_9EURY|nr:FAD/NAD(P)-binding protein [Natrarchaeobaculum aegyptiacum]ARS88312.1 thioredoxin reductase [Natrarchaeobaculum aegyptiacum]
MTTDNSTHTVSCTIVGGGIHGTHLAQRLLEDTPLEPSDVLIVDPHDRLLASFREKAKSCRMKGLRSSFVHHVGTDPFGLERFAEANERESELVPTVDYPPRPSLDLFLDYSDAVIERKHLESLHRRATVDGIHERPGTTGLRLETSAGPIETDHCVLAIGHGNQYRWPAWATGLDEVEHVWEGFEPDASADRTIVVGGGITAAQLACALSETQSVALLSRHPLEWEVSEAAPPWINWEHVKHNLHTLPPGSSERLDLVSDARNTATVPPYFYEEVADRIDDGVLTLSQGDVESATVDDGTVRLSLDHGLEVLGDRVVLATGFEPVFEHPFVDRIAERLEMVRGHRGIPVLDDETLAWRSDDGRFVPLYVSGALAMGSVGPYAPNIPGARRAGDRITAAIARRLRRPGNDGVDDSIPTPEPFD